MSQQDSQTLHIQILCLKYSMKPIIQKPCIHNALKTRMQNGLLFYLKNVQKLKMYLHQACDTAHNFTLIHKWYNLWLVVICNIFLRCEWAWSWRLKFPKRRKLLQIYSTKLKDFLIQKLSCWMKNQQKIV